MSTWYSLELGDGVAAYNPTMAIMHAFTPVFAAADTPIDMALFSRTENNVVKIYFTHRASDFGKTVGAVPCEKPIREGIALLVGDHRAWEHFYPESQGK
jgi:hypothetical protein